MFMSCAVIIYVGPWLVFGAAFSIYRMVRALITLRCLSRISFVPRGSLALRDYGGFVQTNQNEFCRLIRIEPVAYPIDLLRVPGHCESIRWSRIGSGTEIEVEVDVIGQGVVDVLMFVPRFQIEEVIASGRGRRFETGGIEHFYFNNISDEDDDDLITIVVVISGPSDMREVTGGYSTAPGDPILNYFQFVKRSGKTDLVVRGIYTQQEECMVCYERLCNTVTVPCRHCSICTSCMLQLRNRRCVVCRISYEAYLSLPFQNLARN
jgi:hypothetical protein